MCVAAFSLQQIGITCERVRQPHLQHAPLALAGEDELVRVASPDTLPFGIRPGMTVSAARSLCPGLIVLPYDAAAYLSMAEAAWDLLAIESSVVEPVTPEMAFVHLPDADALPRAGLVARAIAAHLGIPVSVGLGKTKMVAHHAALSKAKDPEDCGPVRVMQIPAGQETVALADVSLLSIKQLDAKLKARAEKLGVRTLGDVLALPPSELHRQFKQVSLLLQRLASGEDSDPVRASWPPPRHEASLSFDDEVTAQAILEHGLMRCAARISFALLQRSDYCRSLHLSVTLEDGRTVQGWEKLVDPIHEAEQIALAARRLLMRLPAWQQGVTGVCLSASELGSGSGLQLALLDEAGGALPDARVRALEATLSHMRQKHGPQAVLPGKLLHEAQRIHLWTEPLCHRRQEPIQVDTDTEGVPVRYHRRKRGRLHSYVVTHIQNRWRETQWFWGRVLEIACYRVLADPDGLYELHRQGVEWTLVGIAD